MTKICPRTKLFYNRSTHFGSSEHLTTDEDIISETTLSHLSSKRISR